MKRIVNLGFSILLTISALAQSQQEVAQLLDGYEKAMLNRQWVKSLDYVYPKLFEVVPREMMAQTITNTFNDTSVFRIGFQEMELLEVSDMYKESGLQYSFADYSMIMDMELVNESTDEQVQMYADMMKVQFGEDQVSVDGNRIIISSTNKMAILKNDGDSKLYMLEIKAELKEIMSSFMSDEFIARAFDS